MWGALLICVFMCILAATIALCCWKITEQDITRINEDVNSVLDNVLEINQRTKEQEDNVLSIHQRDEERDVQLDAIREKVTYLQGQVQGVNDNVSYLSTATATLSQAIVQYCSALEENKKLKEKYASLSMDKQSLQSEING